MFEQSFKFEVFGQSLKLLEVSNKFSEANLKEIRITNGRDDKGRTKNFDESEASNLNPNQLHYSTF